MKEYKLVFPKSNQDRTARKLAPGCRSNVFSLGELWTGEWNAGIEKLGVFTGKGFTNRDSEGVRRASLYDSRLTNHAVCVA